MAGTLPGIWFICPFLDLSQDYYYCQHSGSFKVQHFFLFIFPGHRIYYYCYLVILKSINFKNLSNIKCKILHDLPISRTLLSILADLSSAVVWVVSVLQVSSWSSFFSRFYRSVPRTLTINSITVTFMFHNFFSSLARSRYLSSFSLYFSFTLWSDNYFTPCKFFTPTNMSVHWSLRDKQVSSGLQTSSEYSSWS